MIGAADGRGVRAIATALTALMMSAQAAGAEPADGQVESPHVGPACNDTSTWHRSAGDAHNPSCPAGTAAVGVPPNVIYRTIALSGDPAPDTGEGVTLFNVLFEVNFPAAPMIDDDANVSFHAVLEGPDIDPSIFGNGSTVYTHLDGTLHLIARQAEPAPETRRGVTFQGFPIVLAPFSPLIAAGRVVVTGSLTGRDIVIGVNSDGLWTDRAGPFELFMRIGETPAPGAPPGSTFTGFALPAFDAQGRITINALYNDGAMGPDEEGIWSDRSGRLELLVSGGDPAPGTEPGVVFGQGGMFAIGGSFRNWSLDGEHQIAFHGNLVGPGIDDLNDEGIWVEAAGGTSLLAREGQNAPGFADPLATFGISSGIDAFGVVSRGTAGALVFDCRVGGGSIRFAEGLYTDRSGALELIARGFGVSDPIPGDPAPGVGSTFVSFLTAVINEGPPEGVTFVASTKGPLDGGNLFDFGIWTDQPGSLTLVAADGVQVPGQADGVQFGVPEGNSNTYSIRRLLPDGRLVFTAILGGPALPSSTGLFVTDSGGTPHLVLRPGQQFVVDDGIEGDPDVRTVAGMLVGTANSSGEVAVKLHFNDDTLGVFTVRLAICTGDVDGDGEVGIADFLILLGNWGPNPGHPADIDGDGEVGIADFLALLGNWGPCQEAVASREARRDSNLRPPV